MAYWMPDDEENQQQATGGGGGSAPTSGGAKAPAQQQQAPAESPQQQSGTGFTNLRSWLDAGQGRAGNISAAGDKTLGGLKTSFAAATKPLEDATFDPTKVSADDAKQKLASDKAGDIGFLRSALDQKYTGARTVDWNGAAGMNTLGQLGNASTAAGYLGGQAQAGYGGGNRRLDEAMFGADSASQAAMGNVTGNATAFKKDANATGDRLKAKVEGFDKAAADANAANAATLRGIGDQALAGLDQRVAGANSADAIAKRTGPIAGHGDFQWQEGTGANRGNMATASDAALFGNLRSLLGDTKYDVQRNGTYHGGAYGANPSIQQAPSAPPPAPTAPGMHWDPQAGNDQTRFFNGGTGGWVDQNGKVQADFHPMDYDPLSGTATNKVTGEKMDINNAMNAAGNVGGWYIDPRTQMPTWQDPNKTATDFKKLFPTIFGGSQ